MDGGRHLGKNTASLSGITISTTNTILDYPFTINTDFDRRRAGTDVGSRRVSIASFFLGAASKRTAVGRTFVG